MLEIDASSNIRIFGAKTETSQPYASISNSDDIFMTNIIDFAHFGAVAKNYIEITGNSDKLDAFIESIDEGSIIEVVRSGTTGISRGEKGLHL